MEENNQTTPEVTMEENKKQKGKKVLVVVLVCILIMLVTVFGVIAVLLFKQYTAQKEVKIKTVTKKPVEESAYRLSGNDLQDFDLYFLQLENKQSNQVYSPLSIKYALAMLEEGSDGTTRSQIESVIGDYKAKKYTNSEHMSFANAMFIRNSFKDNVKKSYTKNLQEKYGADVIYDAFENASTMNNWVSEKTFKLISNLIDDETAKNGNFFLVNALAIDMNWKTRLQHSAAPLPKGMTQKLYSVNYYHEKYSASIYPIMDEKYPTMEFNGTNNIKSVEIGASFNRYDIINDIGEDNIRKTVTTKYQEYLDGGGSKCADSVSDYVDGYIKAIGKNYKSEATSTDFYIYDDDELKLFGKDLQNYDGTNLQYVAIMPKEASLDQYIKELNAKSLSQTLEKLTEVKYENFEEGTITSISGNIPLFKFDYKLDLINDLKTLGITDAFDVNAADLSRMVTDKQYIFSASHKATIEFSNDGIKAAAATSMGGTGASGCPFDYEYEVPIKKIDITMNKPYLFMIRDKDSGEVWFVGTVYNPTKK